MAAQPGISLTRPAALSAASVLGSEDARRGCGQHEGTPKSTRASTAARRFAFELRHRRPARPRHVLRPDQPADVVCRGDGSDRSERFGGSSSPPTMGRAGVRSTLSSTPNTSRPRSPSIQGARLDSASAEARAFCKAIRRSSDGGETSTRAEDEIVRLLRPYRVAHPALPIPRTVRVHELLRDLGRRLVLVARVLAAVLGSVAGLRPNELVDSVRSIQRIDRPDVLRRRLQECRWRRLLDGRQRGLTNSTAGGSPSVCPIPRRCFRATTTASSRRPTRRHLGECSDRAWTGGGRGSGRSADSVRQPALFCRTEHLPALHRRRRHLAAAGGLRSIPVSRRPRHPAPRTRTSSTPS